jgi:hypothetical protein
MTTTALPRRQDSQRPRTATAWRGGGGSSSGLARWLGLVCSLPPRRRSQSSYKACMLLNPVCFPPQWCCIGAGASLSATASSVQGTAARATTMRQSTVTQASSSTSSYADPPPPSWCGYPTPMVLGLILRCYCYNRLRRCGTTATTYSLWSLSRLARWTIVKPQSSPSLFYPHVHPLYLSAPFCTLQVSGTALRVP